MSICVQGRGRGGCSAAGSHRALLQWAAYSGGVLAAPEAVTATLCTCGPSPSRSPPQSPGVSMYAFCGESPRKQLLMAGTAAPCTPTTSACPMLLTRMCNWQLALNRLWMTPCSRYTSLDPLQSFSANTHVLCSGNRGLRKDLFGRYKKKDGSRSRSRSPQRNERPRGRLKL